MRSIAKVGLTAAGVTAGAILAWELLSGPSTDQGDQIELNEIGSKTHARTMEPPELSSDERLLAKEIDEIRGALPVDPNLVDHLSEGPNDRSPEEEIDTDTENEAGEHGERLDRHDQG
ncbi:MAG: hypothetical protein KDD53_05710, partial [Bdellovibrionales bacterium]|nr:hypothetical protein [Bdellovibrionales bacterium]